MPITPAYRIEGMDDLDTSRICYWKEAAGAKDGEDLWWVYLPGCGAGVLAHHNIVEHEDSTITVQPSILMTGHDDGKRTHFHGYLERGIWRDC